MKAFSITVLPIEKTHKIVAPFQIYLKTFRFAIALNRSGNFCCLKTMRETPSKPCASIVSLKPIRIKAQDSEFLLL
jgi:hypothetical protein